MKIVHVVWTFQNGGIETMLVNTVNCQQALGHKVYLLVINNSIDRELLGAIDNSIKVFEIKRIVNSRNLSPIIKMNLLLILIRPKIVHFHSYSISKLFINIYKINYLSTIHSTHLKNNIKKSDNIISISEVVSKDVMANNPEIKPILCHNGIDFTRIIKKEKTTNIKKIICVGRLDDNHKGQSTIINAIKILKVKKIGNINLTIVGEGKSKSDLIKLITKLKINSDVSILGNKSNKWVLNNLHKYDLFIQASKFEGFGLTAVEAMGAKIPVILSDVEGHLEISQNGKYAYLFKVNDCHDLAEKIIYLKKNNEAIKRKSDDAYNHVVNKYTTLNQVNKLIEIYNNL